MRPGVAFWPVLLLLAGCAASLEGDSASDVERTWIQAERFVPAKANPPVVVFLHGCTGITGENRAWGTTLRDAGYLVVMPDSFARRGRRQDCDPASRTGQSDLNTPFHRAEEAAYAAGQLVKSRPPKLVLMGHSEGALAVQYWSSPEPFQAAILSGTACSRINLPMRLPTLVVRYEHDPWDPQPQMCTFWAGERANTSVHLVPGSGHDAARHPDVQRRVISFLNGL